MPRFELAPLIRLKKLVISAPLQISTPFPREKMSFATQYDIRDVYGLYGSFNDMRHCYRPNANMADHSVIARDELHESEVSEASLFCFDNASP